MEDWAAGTCASNKDGLTRNRFTLLSETSKLDKIYDTGIREWGIDTGIRDTGIREWVIVILK